MTLYYEGHFAKHINVYILVKPHLSSDTRKKYVYHFHFFLCGFAPFARATSVSTSAHANHVVTTAA